MGLDMYLHASHYVSGWKHSRPEGREQYGALLEMVGLASAATPESPGATVRVTVAYWRKANAIHRWFVENVQDGEDDCGDYYVSHEQLTELRDTCQRALVLAKVADGQPVHAGTTYRKGEEPEQHFETGRAALNGERLAEILPTQSGFFFGPTDYDEYYLSDLEDTVQQIDRVLANAPNADLYYHSSW